MFNNYFNNKTVMVLGHTGFKGAWLTQWLINLGAKVIGVSNYIPSTPSLYEVLDLKSQIEDFRVDIRDYSILSEIFNKTHPEIVFHLAAQPIVSISYIDPKLTFDTNLGGTVNVLEAIKNTASVQTVVMITSDKCYENVEWAFGYRETDRLGGKDPYSASKACAEIAINAYFQSFFKCSNKRIASVRAGNVIGGGDWAKNRIVPDCVRAWAKSESVILRSPNATRPWQHVLEPLSGYLSLAEQLHSLPEKLNGTAFNFGPDAANNFSVLDLISSMTKYWLGSKYEIVKSGSIGNEAGLLKLCCDKAQYYLNWLPTLSFDKTVRFTCSWYKAYYDNEKIKKFTNEQIFEYSQNAQERNREWSLEVKTVSQV